jgi:hypothetical protein
LNVILEVETVVLVHFNAQQGFQRPSTPLPRLWWPTRWSARTLIHGELAEPDHTRLPGSRFAL